MDTTMQYSVVDRAEAAADWPPGISGSGSIRTTKPGESSSGDKGKHFEEDWVEIRVNRDDTVSKLAIRYDCDPITLRAVNRLPSDMMLTSRNTVLVPPHDPKAKPPPPPLTEDEVRERKVRHLMRTCLIPVEEARYYLSAGEGDTDQAVEEFLADKAWEGKHPMPGSSACCS